TTALERDRNVDIRAAPHEALRHDADHRAHDVVEAHLVAEDVRIPAELPLPETVSKDYDRRRARTRIVRVGRAADERRHAHDVERVERAMVAAQPLRISLA